MITVGRNVTAELGSTDGLVDSALDPAAEYDRAGITLDQTT